MTDRTLLHLDSSHSGHSVSRELTARFAQLWLEEHGPGGYGYRDLAADPVPLVSSAYVDLGERVERHGEVQPEQVSAMVQNSGEKREWALTLPLIDQVRSATTVLIGVPMYNFGVPASLKAWIDRISFPGAFAGTDGPALAATRVVLVIARGGAYGPGLPRASFDFQEPYLRAYFGNLGVRPENLQVVRAEGTRAGDRPEYAQFRDFAVRSRAEAEREIERLAGRPIGAAAAVS